MVAECILPAHCLPISSGTAGGFAILGIELKSVVKSSVRVGKASDEAFRLPGDYYELDAPIGDGWRESWRSSAAAATPLQKTRRWNAGPQD